MKTVTRIDPAAPVLKPRKRVAAYARVSMETERLQHSLSAQVSYYNSMIQKNPDWVFAGVYVDDGISGTGTAKRDDFNRMIADADAGKIDIILTKSISRFARNTVDLLETVRHLFRTEKSILLPNLRQLCLYLRFLLRFFQIVFPVLFQFLVGMAFHP